MQSEEGVRRLLLKALTWVNRCGDLGESERDSFLQRLRVGHDELVQNKLVPC